MYKVRIEKKHCIGASYMDNEDCPLYRAIAEQLKDFPLKSVGGNYIRDKNDVFHYFKNFSDIDHWGDLKMQEILNEEIPYFDVTFN